MTELPVLSIITWAPFVAASSSCRSRGTRPLLVRCVRVVGATVSLVLLAVAVLRLRPGGSRVPVRRGVRARAVARHLVQLRGRRHQRADVLLTSIILFAGVFASWTVKTRGQEFYALLLILVDGRVRRVRVARPVRLLPLLRDRRPADVPADRHLGLVGRGAATGHLRLGDRPNRRRHQGIRGDEADAVPAARVGVHPGRHPGALRGHRVDRHSRSSRLSRFSSTRRCRRGSFSRSTSASAFSPASGRCIRGRPTATRLRRPPSRCFTPAC